MSIKMATFFYQENNHGIMGDQQHGEYLDGAFISSSSSSSTNSSSSDVSSGAVSSDSDLFEEEEEVNSSSSSSPSSTTPTSVSTRSKDSLHDMSSLLQVLPLKRGLSKHYNGKSQSFTCLSKLRCFEDLAKPENPYNKKLKSCKSYQDFDHDDENHGSNILQITGSTGTGGARNSCNSTKLLNYKKASRRGSCSSLCTKKNVSFINCNNRLPIPIPIPIPPPHKSSSFTTQSPLFALGV